MNTWNTLATYFQRRHGLRVQKIPLDVSGTCPNRDGTLSTKGCIFCNAKGSGSGLGAIGMNLEEQWNHWHTHFSNNKRALKYIAYFQSFSNTYGPIKKTFYFLETIQSFTDIIGYSIGTRPDCLSKEYCEVLAKAPFSERWIELGVQSLHDASLRKINRGHTAQCSTKAIERASKAGLSVCAHVMAGLPSETPEDFLATIRQLNELPIQGIKFHNTYIEQDTALAHLWQSGKYEAISADTYRDMIIEALLILRSDIVVHRVVADPDPTTLCAPLWAATDKVSITRQINNGYCQRLGIISKKRIRRRRARD